MLRPLSTNLALAQTDTPERSIVTGDFVYVYDEQRQDYLWKQVAELRHEHGSLTVRLVDTCYFFDSSFVAAVAYLTGGGI